MPKRSYSDEQFIDAVKKSTSWRQVFTKLGLKVGGGQYVLFKNLAKNLELNLDHMTGKGWNVGDNYKSPRPAKSLKKILVENYDGGTSTGNLKKRLWKENLLDRKCYRCNSVEWFGQINHLQLEHINGIRNDNRLKNLTILCANCHSLTDTYCSKNRGKTS